MNYDLDTLRGDLFGGVTSMVVALPLSLGFGIASGLGAAAGLYGAITVGFFAAAFMSRASRSSNSTCLRASVTPSKGGMSGRLAPYSMSLFSLRCSGSPAS